jgi:hypothetical protein
MKRKLLFGALLASLGLSAQETHHINWFMGVTPAAATMTVNAGDTVMWEWADTLPHSVTSNAGGTDTFESGILTGDGETFSHTFTTEGSTSYKCNVHEMMQGVITVDAVAGVHENNKLDFEYFPNPTTDILTINSKEVIDRIEIYDINGKQVMNSKSGNPTSKVYMANYKAGTYFVKVFVGNKTENITVVKK